jgi:predicted small lipoprotein YifL
MMQHSYGSALAAILLASMAVAGCGLKGALTMPSKSDEVVIRAPAEAAPAEPTREAPAAKKPPKDERIPPPPLPGGNPGTARSG